MRANQSPFRNICTEREAWTNNDAMSGERDAMQESRICGSERAGDAHRLNASVRTLKAPNFVFCSRRRRSIISAICSCSSAIFVKPCSRRRLARTRCHFGDSSRDFSRSSSVDIFCALVARGPPSVGTKSVLGRLADGVAAPRRHQSIPKLALWRARHRRVPLRPRAWQPFVSIPGEAILDRDVIAPALHSARDNHRGGVIIGVAII